MKIKITTIILSVFCIVLAFFLMKNAWKKQELSYDLVEVNHVKYGLFDANEWKIKTSELIFKKLDEADFIGKNREVIEEYVSNTLYNLIGNLEKHVENEKNSGSGGEQLLKHVVAGIINVDQVMNNLKRQIPIWSGQIVDAFQQFANDPNVKQIVKDKVSNFIQADKALIYPEIDKLKTKYNANSIDELKSILQDKISKSSSKILYLGIPLILLSLISFVLFFKIEIERAFWGMTIILLTLLVVGISIPMIQIEAKLDLFQFNILGESIMFADQSLFYQSKSILQVFKILLQDGKFLSIITAVFIIMFSIIFPVSKIIASILYRRGADSPIINFLCFKSSKWSMADVMVVAIFLSYIGLNSLIESQMNAMTKTVNQLNVVASTGSSGLQFGVLVFLCFVILSIFYSIKLKDEASYYSSNKSNYF